MGGCLSRRPSPPAAAQGLSYNMMRSRQGEDPLEYYHVERILGEGSMGRVVSVRHKVTQEVFALKTISLFRVSNSLIAEMKNEINMLRFLDHPSIIRPLEMYEGWRTVCFIMEYCSGGDLTVRHPYTESQAATIVMQITAALTYMHGKGICHRDIKMENIMFENESPNAAIKLIDFGLSFYYSARRRQRNQVRGAVGTLYSMAPELMTGADCSPASDMWSLGVIAYMLLANQMPFFAVEAMTMVSKITEADVSFHQPVWKQCSTTAIDFIRKLLNQSPEARMTATDALKHPWIQDTPSQTVKPADETAKFDEQIVASLRQYCEYTTLQKAAFMVIAYHSSSIDIAPLRRAFKRCNTARNGYLTFEDLQAFLAKHGVHGEEEARRIFDGVNLDHTGRITYTEFLAAALEAMGQLRKEQVVEAFQRLDVDDDGTISKRDLSALLGKHYRRQDVENVLEQVDCKKCGKVNLEAFILIMSQEYRRRRTISSYTSSEEEWPPPERTPVVV